MEVNYTLLENGLDFLVMAINDVNMINNDRDNEVAVKRLIKYALLHLSSGVELIIKNRLLKENWTYIFSDMNKAKKELLKNGEFRSVDSLICIERLEEFCEIKFKKEDLKMLSSLRNKRNKFEHFNVNESVDSIEAIIYGVVNIALKFIAETVDIKEMSEEERSLLDQIMELTLELGNIIEQREEVVKSRLRSLGKSGLQFECPECQKIYLMKDDVNWKCEFCNHEVSPEDAASNYISTVMGISDYEYAKDGLEWPLDDCPECSDHAFVVDVDRNFSYCFNCETKISLDKIDHCLNCNTLIYSETEGDMIICQNCLDELVNNSD